ncbi:acyl-CoA dehydrogenase family protein [Legionella impletisoli]|uniref:Acyl-CoA dehydrogenase n=1 Tax=Legionella impletisoli TaxID=343510 RepID=A0A917NBV0_9GAMM|nr:acyl-CoA dehydrogenase family protein [Legionella impletisoli]GGI81825.1 acyl-CoA dehydrogenase [Legionella impletisoli]
MTKTTNAYETARDQFKTWESQLKQNILLPKSDLMHTYRYYFSEDIDFIETLQHFACQVAEALEPVVRENNLDEHLPTLQQYDAIGERQDVIKHSPLYAKAGDIIYGSGIMGYLNKPGQMLKTLSLFILSSHAGEAGHNCPIACSAGVMRILNKYSDLKETGTWIEKLSLPSFQENYTGAQFLTEIQGGSDVGANASYAYQDEEGHWRISGEKWFCSNANAELILMTARFDQTIAGTKGLGLFLVPSTLADGSQNHYRIRRLKQKFGTRSMATAEIDFKHALAYPMGKLEQGINLVMENVLHLSRIFNAFSVLGMARRAYQTAYYYALNRSAFEHKILDYPLVKESIATIKADNTVMIASVFHMVRLQDDFDLAPEDQKTKEKQLLLRTLANINKYFTAKYSVEHIHHCLDVLAGNGTIESFSSLPRLLRDCIVCENWEGTHFVLWMQVLKDIHRFEVDEIFLSHLRALSEELTHDLTYKRVFEETIKDLEEAFSNLKTVAIEEQTLLFKEIVEKMAISLAGLTLALELQDESASSGKKACLELFISRHITSDKLPFERYTTLLNRVITQST